MTTTLERAGAVGGAKSSRLAANALVAHSAAGAVLVAYIAAAVVMPTMANVAVTDDWVYYRAVETLLRTHQVTVPEMSSAALVFQTLWGALFAAAFGLSFGVVRLSTLVMVGLGGLAVYALCRELNLSRTVSALAMAACLFHPLFLSLTYTFMTDPHFVALLLIATWLYVRGFRPGRADVRYVLAASVVASCAMLVRQQGVLIPAGVLLALVLARRLTPRMLALTCGVPASVAIGFGLWLRYVNGTPYALSLFYDDIANAGWSGVVELVPRLAIIEAIYVGLFVLPIALALVPVLRWPRAGSGLVALGWTAIVVGGAVSYWLDGRKAMPYVGQFVTPTGIGPEDLIAARPVLLDQTVRVGLTIGCAAASVLAAVVIARRVGRSQSFLASGAGLTACIGLGQVAGTLPSSVHFIGWGGTLDRYLLPILPFAIVLLLWSVQRVPLLPLAWIAVAVMGAWSIAGTRDHLVWLDDVWSLAHEANGLGIPDTRLDAGAGWDGFHVYSQPPDPSIRPRTPNPPWWAQLFAPGTDSSYIVAGARLPDHAVILERSYFSWLHQRSISLYLLRRPGVQGPP